MPEADPPLEFSSRDRCAHDLNLCAEDSANQRAGSDAVFARGFDHLFNDSTIESPSNHHGGRDTPPVVVARVAMNLLRAGLRLGVGRHR